MRDYLVKQINLSQLELRHLFNIIQNLISHMGALHVIHSFPSSKEQLKDSV